MFFSYLADQDVRSTYEDRQRLREQELHLRTLFYLLLGTAVSAALLLLAPFDFSALEDLLNVPRGTYGS